MWSYSKFEHNYTKSVFKHIEPLSDEFEVSVNGEKIPVYTCRISKYPFNTVWPGHQRAFEQTETAAFVSLVSDQAITLEVTPKCEYGKIKIKPCSEGVKYAESNGKITFELSKNGQYVFECDDYHHCLYIFNSKPILPPKPDEVTHYFGAGVHFPGKITLKSNDSVYIDKDALVFGCIYAENAKSIRIFGNGLIDDSGEERISIHCYENYTNGNLKFYDCTDLKIEGILMRNSAIWCVNLFHCFNVRLDGIKIFGQWRYNTDGIDIVNSQDIAITNSFVHSFDDTITIKGIDRYADTDNRNIQVDGCVLWCDWGRCCEIGIETACALYENISFKNCDILRGGHVALDIQNGDYAEVRGVVFESINVEYNAGDTLPVYQRSDAQEYTDQSTQFVPRLISIDNRRFRTPENEKAWGVPHEAVKRLGGVRSISYKSINIFCDDELLQSYSNPIIKISIVSHEKEVEFKDITISDISLNGHPADLTTADIELSGVNNLRIE